MTIVIINLLSKTFLQNLSQYLFCQNSLMENQFMYSQCCNSSTEQFDEQVSTYSIG